MKLGEIIKFKKNYIFGFVIFIIFEILTISFFKFQKNDELEKAKIRNIQNLKIQINSILNFYATTSEILVNKILSDAKNKTILQSFENANDENSDKARAALFENLNNEYELLTKYDFRQLHFHDKYGNSFLRFHQVDYFGDNLYNIRHTIKAVHDTKKPVFGFEEGKIVNGFRNVFPIIYDGKFYGSVELSNSFSGIINQLHKNFDSEFKLLIEKSDVDQKLFQELISKNYFISRSSDFFYEEKIFENQKNKNISNKIIEKIDQEMKNKNIFTNSKKETVKSYKIDGKYYLVTAIALQNFDKSVTTLVLSYNKNDSFYLVERNFWFSIFLANMLGAFLLILIALNNKIKTSNIYRQKANTDNLTGLGNRHKFENDCKILFSNPLTKDQIAIILIDIDFFKNVNDNFGHAIGDAVLIDFAKSLKNSLRSNDLIYRWGGEEFIVMLQTNEKNIAFNVAENLRKMIICTNFIHKIKLTFSCGIAVCEGEESISKIIERADKNLYIAKEQGRNKSVI